MGALEQIRNDMAHREQGRARVERVACPAMNIDFAAGRFVLFKNRNARARLCETNGGGESAESCADDDNFFVLHFVASRRASPLIINLPL